MDQTLNMQRYRVTIVSSADAQEQPVVLVPFHPSALVTNFIDELYKRAARQGLPVTPDTHVATLHLDSETGAIVDCEDVLQDVLPDPKTKSLFAVFTRRPTSAALPVNSHAKPPDGPSGTRDEGPSLSVRIVTPASAKDRGGFPTLTVSSSITFKQLHDQVIDKLQLSSKVNERANGLECNCKLASQLSHGAQPTDQFPLVHGKSKVERLQLKTPTEAAVREAVRLYFGQDLELTKKLMLKDGEFHESTRTMYKKTPVVAICSRQRHVPVHARIDIDETGCRRSKMIDLHKFELPIHPACLNATLFEANLSQLATEDVIDVFAVTRTATGQNTASIGKSSIFRMRAHWEPSIIQSDRGMAMFLSSLRVFCSLVQEMGDDDRGQDAVLHVFDLITNFPPAVRTLHILVKSKTPTPAESAAFSQAVFEVLKSIVPVDIIGSDQSRAFEGACLLFGFIFDKAKTLKLPDEEGVALPYCSSLQTTDLRDHKTGEPVMHALNTKEGLVESTLYESFQEGSVLVNSHLQIYMVKSDLNTTVIRQALLSRGAAFDITALSLHSLHSNYRYVDSGDISIAIDLNEVSDLKNLADLCGRRGLVVHKPSQLSSAITPCLTFDRNAHLAVYTGEQPCGDPGHSSILFRPLHGDETIYAAVVEQLIAPLLLGYQADGSAVFDALGGAAVRRLQAPDEILMFCVDCSASMRSVSDFDEVNELPPDATEEPDVKSLVEADFYDKVSFDDMKERLCNYEGFSDILAIIAEKDEYRRRGTTAQVVEILRTMLSTAILKKSASLSHRRQYSQNWQYARRELADLENDLDKSKAFWAGLKTHEQPVCDFLIYRATTASHDIAQRWKLSLGDSVPVEVATCQWIPNLPPDVTELPDHIRCPISHTLMEYAVTAVDGHTYSHSAISQWFSTRISSPMTGLVLQNASLSTNQAICDAAFNWENGAGILGRDWLDEQPSKRLRASEIEVTFDSRTGSFFRRVSSSMTVNDLYKLAFRGLKAKALVFQLSTERHGPLTPTLEDTVSSRKIKDGDHITVRIADDEPTSSASPTVPGSRSCDSVLVKVYENTTDMLFGFWVKKDTMQTMAAVI